MYRLLFLGMMVAGCHGTEIVLDAGPEPDAGGPTGLLTIESAASLTLGFGEPAEIVVRYTENGAPVEGVEVDFGLEGRAHDSTVEDLTLTTDRDGRVTTAILAGSQRTVFRVRATTDRAAAAYVDVAVGDMGFGTLIVGAVYEGRREAAARRVVSVYTEIDCVPTAELPARPDRELILDDQMEVEGSAVLTAGLRYAVYGRVEGEGGGILASACVDGLVIAADSELRVDLSFDDAPLIVEGDYELEVELAPGETRMMAAAITATAAKARVELAGSGASFYLDALENELNERGEIAAAEALALERVTGTPDESLATRLDRVDLGPSIAITTMVARLERRLERISLLGPLALDAEGRGSVMAARLSIGMAGDPDSTPLELEATELPFALMPAIGLEWREEDDVLELTAVILRLPIGALVDATLAAEARAMALGDPSDLLVENAGCDVLAAWIGESPTLAPACDADCARAVCGRALDTIAESIRAATMAADETRHTIEIAGELLASDRDGDLYADELNGEELEGAWTGSLGDTGDALMGTLRARRVVD
jgi:hypothetical protein